MTLNKPELSGCSFQYSYSFVIYTIYFGKKKIPAGFSDF